jgi:hypothetical protein
MHCVELGAHVPWPPQPQSMSHVAPCKETYTHIKVLAHDMPATYIHTHIHAYMHTHIHVHIHTKHIATYHSTYPEAAVAATNVVISTITVPGTVVRTSEACAVSTIVARLALACTVPPIAND